MRYSKFLQRSLIPFCYSLRGRKIGAYQRFLEQSQWWSADRIADFQWSETQNLLAHAFSSVPYYRKKYSALGIELGDIKRRADFAKLPVLTRDEINEHREELRSTTYLGKILAKATGGSTGIPTRFYITLDSYDWRSAASARAYSWSGCEIGERALYLWGAPVGKVSAWNRAKVRTYHALRRELIVNTFAQDEAFWRGTYERAVRFRPRYIVGYVSSVEQFSQYLLKEHLQLAEINAVVAAAEPVFGSTRNLVASALGAAVFNTYGSREFMSIAAECDRHEGLHIHSENLLVETEFPDNPNPSEILVTDLHNYGMPFIRYRIGDIGLINKGTCSCGRGLPTLSSVEGRTLDVLRTSGGRVVPGELFPHVLKDIPEVREFQVEQKSFEEIKIYAVLSAAPSAKSEALLKSEFGKAFGDSIRVTLAPVDFIPKRPSGKRRTTIGLASFTSANKEKPLIDH